MSRQGAIVPGTYPHDAQLDYFGIADNTPGMCGARTGPSCAARGVSSFTGDEGVLCGQDFPVAVALFKDVFQVSP